MIVPAAAREVAPAARLGSRITTLQHGSRLIVKDDPEASAALLRVLRYDDVTDHLNAETVRAERSGAGVRLHLKDGQTVEGTHLLVAVGKTPRVQGCAWKLSAPSLTARA